MMTTHFCTRCGWVNRPKGIDYRRTRNRFRVRSYHYGREFSHGSFRTLEDAVKVRESVAKAGW
jgi:hypothetical protein